MGALHRPAWGITVTSGIIFDPGGIGARAAAKPGQEGAELVVAMRPSTFLALATPLPAPRPSLAWITAQLRAGRAICPPGLRVWLPADWAGTPAVTMHDGRHRATAVHALAGDVEVPVRIALPGLDSDAEVPRWAVDAMRQGMWSQGGQRTIVPGPLFGATSADPEEERPARRHRRVRAPPRLWEGRPGRRRTGLIGFTWNATAVRHLPSSPGVVAPGDVGRPVRTGAPLGEAAPERRTPAAAGQPGA